MLESGPTNYKAMKLKEEAVKGLENWNDTELNKKVEEHAKVLRAFWVVCWTKSEHHCRRLYLTFLSTQPGVQADASETILPKPSKKTKCPQSGKPLR